MLNLSSFGIDLDIESCIGLLKFEEQFYISELKIQNLKFHLKDRRTSYLIFEVTLKRLNYLRFKFLKLHLKDRRTLDLISEVALKRLNYFRFERVYFTKFYTMPV